MTTTAQQQDAIRYVGDFDSNGIDYSHTTDTTEVAQFNQEFEQDYAGYFIVWDESGNADKLYATENLGYYTHERVYFVASL